MLPVYKFRPRGSQYSEQFFSIPRYKYHGSKSSRHMHWQSLRYLSAKFCRRSRKRASHNWGNLQWLNCLIVSVVIIGECLFSCTLRRQNVSFSVYRIYWKTVRALGKSGTEALLVLGDNRWNQTIPRCLFFWGFSSWKGLQVCPSLYLMTGCNALIFKLTLTQAVISTWYSTISHSNSSLGMEAVWVDLQHPYNAGKQFLLARILMQLCYLLKQSLPGTAWVTFHSTSL